MIQLEQRHFTMFKAEVQRIIDFFGLHGWKTNFTFIQTDKDGKDKAHVNLYLFNRIQYFNLEPMWKFNADDEQDQQMTTCFSETDIDNLVKEAAFHEVMENLLTRLRLMTSWRSYCELDVDEEIHSIIRIFENKVYPLIPTC